MAEDGQPLPMKFQDHHEFPEFDHRADPSRQGDQHSATTAPPAGNTTKLGKIRGP